MKGNLISHLFSDSFTKNQTNWSPAGNDTPVAVSVFFCYLKGKPVKRVICCVGDRPRAREKDSLKITIVVWKIIMILLLKLIMPPDTFPNYNSGVEGAGWHYTLHFSLLMGQFASLYLHNEWCRTSSRLHKLLFPPLPQRRKLDKQHLAV